ncbi:MAG: SDR family oxidoreductase [Mobilitalea sp.]
MESNNFNKISKEKIVLVTGANSGMGKATVAALADTGAMVVMLCRDQVRGTQALEELSTIADRKLDLMLCDLGDLSSIRTFTEAFSDKYQHLDILICNAGVITLDRRETVDGFEQQFGVNYLGHFLLTMRLLPMMSSGSRIINICSGAHKIGKIHFEDLQLTKHYNVISAYGQSKLATLLFTRELAARLHSYGITVNACHPGAVATSMGVDRKTGFGKTIVSLLKPFFLTPKEGAKTGVYLATSKAVAMKSGQYYYKCKVFKSSKISHSKKLSRKLFEISETLTGESFEDVISLEY